MSTPSTTGLKLASALKDRRVPQFWIFRPGRSRLSTLQHFEPLRRISRLSAFWFQVPPLRPLNAPEPARKFLWHKRVLLSKHLKRSLRGNLNGI